WRASRPSSRRCGPCWLACWMPLPLDSLALPAEIAEFAVRHQARHQTHQMVSYPLWRLQAAGRHIGVKRTRELGIHSARMKRQQLDARGTPGEFDGRALEQHIESGLGSTIAIPTTSAVVTNAADPGTEHRQGAG